MCFEGHCNCKKRKPVKSARKTTSSSSSGGGGGGATQFHREGVPMKRQKRKKNKHGEVVRTKQPILDEEVKIRSCVQITDPHCADGGWTAKYQGKGDNVYDVHVYDDDSKKDTCTCPYWAARNTGSNVEACKHIKHLRRELQRCGQCKMRRKDGCVCCSVCGNMPGACKGCDPNLDS